MELRSPCSLDNSETVEGPRRFHEFDEQDSKAILPIARRTFEIVMNRNNGTLYDVAIVNHRR